MLDTFTLTKKQLNLIDALEALGKKICKISFEPSSLGGIITTLEFCNKGLEGEEKFKYTKLDITDYDTW